MSDPYENTKDAWVLVFGIHPWVRGYPGVQADLFFSSPEKARECWERDFGEGEVLVPVKVPADFDDWDYVPREY